MSGVPEMEETRSPSTTSNSSLGTEDSEQVPDDEELQQLLEQRASSPSIKSSEERILNEFRSLYSETLFLEQSGPQEETEDDKKVLISVHV